MSDLLKKILDKKLGSRRGRVWDIENLPDEIVEDLLKEHCREKAEGAQCELRTEDVASGSAPPFTAAQGSEADGDGV
jgi:hypothetical protein